MLALYVEAPFAACRTFTAGWYRPTATFLTPSAAYGLLLNLAGIETRLREEDEAHPGTVPTTVTRAGLPAVRLALGAPASRRVGRHAHDLPEADRYPRVQTVYQQLHNYPVGASGADRAASAFGNKYNISPVRRELLVGLRTIVVIDGNPDLEEQVRRGLAGEPTDGRYGLPFLGDNSLLPDRIDVLDDLSPAHWYERVIGDENAIRPRTTRLTVWIDRADSSRTVSHLFAPAGTTTERVPPAAWVDLPPRSPE